MIASSEIALTEQSASWNHPIFVSYEQAQTWAKSQQLASRREWRSLSHIPPHIPRNPCSVYSDFFTRGGWGGFLGTGRTNEKRASLKEMKLWARANAIQGMEHWAQHPDRPKNFLRRPERYYTLEFKAMGGWAGFLGLGQNKGSSRIEQYLASALAECANTPFSQARNRIEGADGKSYLVDMVCESERLIVEYDGRFWHEDKHDYDLEKTRQLEQAGWQVVRLREFGLNLITDRDLIIKANTPAQQKAELLLQHLLNLAKQQRMVLSEAFTAHTQHVVGHLGDYDHQWNKNVIRVQRYLTKSKAAAWFKKNNITTLKQWYKLPNRPLNMPYAVIEVYGEEFKALAGIVTRSEFVDAKGCFKKRDYASFEDTWQWARASGITSRKQWETSKTRPAQYPRSIERTYGEELKAIGGWPAFLNTDHGKFRNIGNSNFQKKAA